MWKPGMSPDIRSSISVSKADKDYLCIIQYAERRPICGIAKIVWKCQSFVVDHVYEGSLLSKSSCRLSVRILFRAWWDDLICLFLFNYLVQHISTWLLFLILLLNMLTSSIVLVRPDYYIQSHSPSTICRRVWYSSIIFYCDIIPLGVERGDMV